MRASFSDMQRTEVAVELRYPWPMAPVEQFVWFELDERDPVWIHARFRHAHLTSGYLVVEDANGDTWPFHTETVARVVSRRRPPSSGSGGRQQEG